MTLSRKNRCVNILSFAITPTLVYDQKTRSDKMVIFEFYYTGYWFNWSNAWYKMYLTHNPNYVAYKFLKD